MRCAKKWRDSYINYGEKPLARGEVLLYTLYKAAVRKTHHLTQPPGPYYYIWEGNRVPNGIYEMCEEKGEWAAMPQARSQAMHYMKGLRGAAALRRYCSMLEHFTDVDTLIDAVYKLQ